MPEVALFCEDSFHEKLVGAMLARFEKEYDIQIQPRFFSARGGLPRMHGEFKDFLRDLSRGHQSLPDALIVVADANCLGYNDRKQDLQRTLEFYPPLQNLVSYCIPDPHIERWMLADSSSFQHVFGRGCTLPAIKCAKDEYKKLLRKEIRDSGRDSLLGGEEFAEDIVEHMDLDRMEVQEPSLGHFLKALKALFNRWSDV